MLPQFAEAVEQRVLVRIFDVTGGWEIGDRVTFEIPHLERTLVSVIEEIRRGPGGRSFIGTHDGGAHGRIVVTVGTTRALATIITGQGAFEMIADGEFGWLMPAANMNRDIDFSQPDYLLAGD